MFNSSSIEAAVRKRWVWAHAWQTTLFSLLMAGLFRLTGLWEIFGEFLAYALAGLIWFWVGYHCAYKKSGTRWLTFWLVLSPFRLLVDLAQGVKEMQGVQGAEYTLSVALIIALIGVFGWWYWMSLKMRKINQKYNAPMVT